MIPLTRFLPVILVSALVGGGGSVCQAAGLSERSPFLPPGFVAPEDRSPAAPPPAATQGPLSRRFEFRGVYELEGEYRFLITDKRTREGKWVPLDDSSAAFHVRSFDLDRNAIVLNHEGQTESIELERLGANTTPMPVAGAPSPSTRPAVAATQSGDGQPPTRTRRPTVRPSGSGNTPAPPPPPQWLQERREAAARARAESGGGPPSPPSSGPPNVPIPPPPGFTPQLPEGMRPPPGGPPNFPN